MRSFAVLLVALLVPLATSAQIGTARLPIVSGKRASSSEIYSTVALVDSNTGQTFCTGTLVAPTVVVTASHCLVNQDPGTDRVESVYEPQRVEVVAGALKPADADAAQRYKVKSLSVNATYPKPGAKDPDGLGEQNDVAVLVLETKVTSLGTTPILPMGKVDDVLKAGTSIIITGYGITAAGGADGGELYIAETPFQRHNGTEYVAGGQGKPDSCQGDSGGPGYVRSGGKLYLVGASARGVQNAATTCGEGGINTLIPAYEGWIKDKSGGAYPSDDGGGGADDSGLGCSVGGHRGLAGAAVLALASLLLLLGWRRRRADSRA